MTGDGDDMGDWEEDKKVWVREYRKKYATK
jgi:hypothetical protein